MSFFKKQDKTKDKNNENKELREVSEKRKVKKNKDNPQILKKDRGIKALRIFVWTIIGLVCFRGIVNIIKPDPVAAMQKNNDKFKAELSKENQIESRAFSFAESFVREYFTVFVGEKDDYQKRLSKYIDKNKIEDLDVKNGTLVESVQSYDIKKYSDNQLDIYVYSKIQVKTEKLGQESITDPNLKQYETSLRDVYVKVPIYYSDGGEMIVENVPTIIGGPKLAVQKENTDSTGLGTANYQVAEEIRDSLNQFFKTYYSGDQTQVDYFLDKPGSISAVGGGVEFIEIEKNSVYDLGNNKFKAVVEFKVKIAGKVLSQKMNVDIEYKGDKYLIKNIDSRTTNFK